MSVIVECKDLSHKYRKTEALQNVNLTIESGKIIGLFGPNGSGKTTLLKYFSGMIIDRDNTISINGNPVGPLTKAVVCFSPDKVSFEDGEKVEDAINFFKNVVEDYDSEGAIQAFEKMNIDTNTLFGKMSKGTAMKAQILLLMCRKAQIYLLDEPFDGIDPVARENIIKVILSMLPEDATLLISTHQIQEVENILDEAIFIKEGRIVLHKAVDEIREEFGKSLNEVYLEGFR